MSKIYDAYLDLVTKGIDGAALRSPEITPEMVKNAKAAAEENPIALLEELTTDFIRKSMEWGLQNFYVIPGQKERAIAVIQAMRELILHSWRNNTPQARNFSNNARINQEADLVIESMETAQRLYDEDPEAYKAESEALAAKEALAGLMRALGERGPPGGVMM